MAIIKQVGVGRKTNGTIDGITYVTRNGVTYARSVPTMPASIYNTPEARKRQALFKLVQMHMKFHLRTIRQTITPRGNGTPSNRYYSLNYKALVLALDTLADQYVAGVDVTLTEIEAAISAYAAEHPTSIRIASKTGYQEVYLTGEWPDTITLYANGGDSTVIIIVAENGTTTTINTDGTTVVAPNSSTPGSSTDNEGSGGETGGGGSTGGSDSGGTTGGGSTEGGDDNGGGGGGPTGDDGLDKD